MEQKGETTLVASLQRAVHALGLAIEGRLGDVSVTQAEAHVLAFLSDRGDSAINDLHRSFGHRRSTLTSVLDRLESRGLVRRGPHPTSRRSVMVQLTAQGEEVGKRVTAELHRIERAVEERTGREDLAAFSRVVTAIEETAHER